MRLHALHLRGLDPPRGTQRIQFPSGYSLVVGSSTALGGLRDVILALLYPERALGELAARRDPEASEAARAVLRVQVGSEVYQIGADVDAQRLALACFDPEAKRFARITTQPTEAGERLRELGRPDRSILETLGFLGVDGGSRVPDSTTREMGDSTLSPRRPAEPASDREEGARSDSSNPPERSAVSGERQLSPSKPSAGEPGESSPQPSHAEPPSVQASNPGERVLELEREEKRLEAEIRKYAVLTEADEDLELRIEQYRTLREDCTRQFTALDHTRQSLLSERIRLLRVPSLQVPWVWIGLGLGAAGATASFFVEPWMGLFGVVGVAMAAVASLLTRRALRRLRRLEARIAALRVRERTLERRFEESASPVRTPLVALELEGVDELADALRLMRNLSTRLEEVRRELEEARLALTEPPPDIRSKDAPSPETPAPPPVQKVSEPPKSAAPQPEEESTPLARARVAGDGPEWMLEAAARWSGRDATELRAELRPILPLYLRAVSGGRLRDMVAVGADLWGIVQEEGGAVPTHVLPEQEKLQVDAAFHLALLERLSSSHRLPLIVGLAAADSFPGDRAGLARALARLGRVIQVVQLAETAEPWEAFAGQSHTLD